MAAFVEEKQKLLESAQTLLHAARLTFIEQVLTLAVKLDGNPDDQKKARSLILAQETSILTQKNGVSAAELQPQLWAAAKAILG